MIAQPAHTNAWRDRPDADLARHLVGNDEYLDAILRRTPRELRRMGDEELHRERLAMRRLEVNADAILTDYCDTFGWQDGPARWGLYTAMVAQARALVEREEALREKARAAGVPRDHAPGWAPEAVVREVKARIDLADLFGRWGLTDLRRVGKKWVGRCPFHEDRNPSFAVLTGDDGQFYVCKSCGEHGDCYDLARKHAGWLTFKEAVEGLAAIAGVDWPPAPPPPPGPPAVPDYLALDDPA
ncbi:MAG TPA: CHC2 zinc finger domain-containing protein [Thermomicrobiales bacterium]|jgi:hypothetical protein